MSGGVFSQRDCKKQTGPLWLQDMVALHPLGVSSENETSKKEGSECLLILRFRQVGQAVKAGTPLILRGGQFPQDVLGQSLGNAVSAVVELGQFGQSGQLYLVVRGTRAEPGVDIVEYIVVIVDS